MLDYLFTATFKDGTEIQQTQEDESSLVPGKSQFYDVLEREDQLERFTLVSVDGSQVIGVWLADGSFFANGLPFMAGDPEFTPPEGTKFRIIFFRRHSHHFTVGMDEISHDVDYHVGWQSTVDGKNHKVTVVVR